jgi:hypothetical protein
MFGSLLRVKVAGAAIAAACLAMGGGLIAQRGGNDQRGEARQGTGAPGITIFAEYNFRGINAHFTRDTPDLRRVNMNDRVDSLRIGRGEVWEVCEDINYKGRCQVFSGDVPNLADVGWGGMISSFRLVRDASRRGGGYPVPPPPLFRPRIILFDRLNFEGRSTAIFDATPSLRSWGNRTGSIKVYGGTWELCDGDRYRGRCETVSDSVYDLARLGLRDKVSSVRPVGRR